MDQDTKPGPAFSPLQKQSLLLGCVDIHRRMAELESLLTEAGQPTLFSRYVADLTPVEQQVLRDYFARIREVMSNLLRAHDIPLKRERVSLRWTATTSLIFLHVAVAEMSSGKLRGYGELTPDGRMAALRIQQELDRLVEQAARILHQGTGGDLAGRLARLEDSVPDLAQALETIEEVVTRRKLVEFRPQVELILRRLENSRLEIAVFGRVGSGKSSLLNHVAGQDVLPVGVTPVTAVPTRLTWGQRSQVNVDFVDAASREIPLSEVEEYASEARNPGNRRHVTRIEVALPSPRLRDGVLLVDTPGVGSLARSGSRETLAYLPQCDLAVVLVDAGSTLNEEDLALLRLLLEAGTPVQILLSKSDLLSQADRSRMLEYVERQVENALGVTLPAFPVSVIGAEEALLHEWFEREVVPLCDRRHELMQASLRRKAAHLRDAILATLELLDRRQSDSPLPEVQDQMRRLLQTGDDLLRDAKSRVLDWRQNRDQQPEVALKRAAEAIVRADDRNTDRPAILRQTIETALREQAQTAVAFADGLPRQLTVIVRELQPIAPDAGVDATAMDRSPPAGLPVPDRNLSADHAVPRPPWWSLGSRRIGSQVVLQRLRESFGADISDSFMDYSRKVEIWLRDYIARLTSIYEAQVEVIRQRLRRRGDDSMTGEAVDATELEQDIRRRREIGSPDGPTDSARSQAAMSADGSKGNSQAQTAAIHLRWD
jgi:GTP-binding protein EngB required for normal cell division